MLCYDVTIGPTNWKNCLTFGSDPVPDADSGSFFHFPHHWYRNSHRSIFTTLGEINDADKMTNPQHFGSDPADIRTRIRINPEIGILILDHIWLRSYALPEVCAVSKVLFSVHLLVVCHCVSHCYAGWSVSTR